MSIFLAALQSAPDAPKIPEIRDIAPPVDIPLPLWVVILLWAGALIVLGLAIWLIVRLVKRKPVEIPPTPRMVALRALEALRPQVTALAPYAFSIAVSDVLRHFVGAQYHLRAEQQTSPEFLAAIQGSRAFTNEDRGLLADFLEKCDLIKFARIDANESTSRALLGSALDFVNGTRL